MLVKGDSKEYLIQKLVLLQKYIQEEILFKYARKDSYLSMDWIGEYIEEMEIQGCTNICFHGRILTRTPFHETSYEQGY